MIDNRRFVERLTERKIPYEYRRSVAARALLDLWDDQLVNFIEMLSR